MQKYKGISNAVRYYDAEKRANERGAVALFRLRLYSAILIAIHLLDIDFGKFDPFGLHIKTENTAVVYGIASVIVLFNYFEWAKYFVEEGHGISFFKNDIRAIRTTLRPVKTIRSFGNIIKQDDAVKSNIYWMKSRYNSRSNANIRARIYLTTRTINFAPYIIAQIFVYAITMNFAFSDVMEFARYLLQNSRIDF